MVLCLIPVVWLVMDPVLIRSRQNLHSFSSLQVECPLSLVVVLRPVGGPETLGSWRTVQLVLALGLFVDVLGIMNSSIDICLVGSLGKGVGTTGTVGGGGMRTKGSTLSSSGFLVTAALHSMSRRCFGFSVSAHKFVLM